MALRPFLASDSAVILFAIRFSLSKPSTEWKFSLLQTYAPFSNNTVTNNNNNNNNDDHDDDDNNREIVARARYIERILCFI